MKKILLLKFALLAGICTAFGQITIGTAMTPQQLVEDVLIGTGVTISNVTYTGQASQIGSFNGTATNLGFAGGVVLSSGGVTTLPGNAGSDPGGAASQFNGPGDASLLQVAQSVTTNPSADLIDETHDRAILEFDFIPTSNQVNFNFVFGSDEYTTYINTQFNDAFGFFVSGPGITGPFASPAGFPGGAANLAVVPGTTLPITISTIHPGLNSEYYVSNAGGTTHTLNAFTVPIPVSFEVMCDSLYHFKFAVADCQDDFLNTVVFLEQNSFTSPPVNFNITGPEGSTGITTITEGCDESPARLYFTRSECQANLPISVNYQVTGSATEGVDYNDLVNPLNLIAGQDSAYIEIIATDDGITEGIEYIIISYSYVNEEGETITTEGTVAIVDPSPVVVNLGADKLVKCEGDAVQLTPVVTGGGGPSAYTYTWQPNGQSTSSINTGPLNNGTYTYIVKVDGACNVTDSDTIQVVVNQTLKISEVIVTNADCGMNNGTVVAIVTGETGQIAYNWSGNGQPPYAASVYENIPAGTYNFTATDDVCTVDTTATITQNPPPTAIINPSQLNGCSPVFVTFTNNSNDALTYEWNLGNGYFAFNSGDPQSATYTQTTEVFLVAKSGLCNDTASVIISISNCGCTNPLALNYDPEANVDDNSCIMPQPEAIAPNVFTPNGDGVNDFFELQMTDVNSVEMTITDRWGNLLFNSSSATPKWDGKTKGGDKADEGVYFYTFKAYGIESTVEGHGFVHLVRD